MSPPRRQNAERNFDFRPSHFQREGAIESSEIIASWLARGFRRLASTAYEFEIGIRTQRDNKQTTYVAPTRTETEVDWLRPFRFDSYIALSAAESIGLAASPVLFPIATPTLTFTPGAYH